jgi:hypothetical protein
MVNSMCSLLLLVFKVKKKSSFPSWMDMFIFN